MRKVWKWILGIFVVLVVLAVVVGGVFLLRSHFNGFTRFVQVFPQGSQAPDGRVPFNGRGQREGPGWMMPYGGHGYPMMGGRGFGFGMMPFAGFLGLFFFLGFVALVVLGIVWLVRSQRRPQQVVAATTMAAAPESPVSAAMAVHSCKKCGQPVPEGSNFCPNCGKKQ